MFKIHGLVLGEHVDAQVFHHSIQLVFVWIFAKKMADFLDFSSQILSNAEIKFRVVNLKTADEFLNTRFRSS